MKRELGIEVEVAVGSFGRFDVLVGDEVVASKAPNLFTRLLGRGEFPDEQETVAAVRARLA